jgi:MerR family mercuric resistance operon transcriptional regulator
VQTTEALPGNFALRKRRSCRATRKLAASKLELVDARIRELRGLRKELAGLIAACDANAEDESCPVMERLTVSAREPLAYPNSNVRSRHP